MASGTDRLNIKECKAIKELNINDITRRYKKEDVIKFLETSQ